MIIKYSSNVIKLCPELFNYVQNSYIEKFVAYCINSKYRKVVGLKDWIEMQTLLLGPQMRKVYSEIPTKESYDQQMIEILRWVKNNIKYFGDRDLWDMTEYWQTAEETAMSRKGDCEDFSILIYVLARVKGVPINRLLIGCGDVKYYGYEVGHAFLLYKPDNYPLNWTVLDGCYHYSGKHISSRNKFCIIGKRFYEFDKNNIEVKSNYRKLWFCFNEKHSYTNLKIDIGGK